MSVEAVNRAVDRVRSTANLFRSLEPQGRSGLDVRAAGMAQKLSMMAEKMAMALRLAYCLTSGKCVKQGEAWICKGPTFRLFLCITPGEISVSRHTDVKVLAYREGDEGWSAYANFGGTEVFMISGRKARLCIGGNQCVEVEPDASMIKQHYSDIRYYAGRLDSMLGKLLEGLQALARASSPQCLSGEK